MSAALNLVKLLPIDQFTKTSKLILLLPPHQCPSACLWAGGCFLLEDPSTEFLTGYLQLQTSNSVFLNLVFIIYSLIYPYKETLQTFVPCPLTSFLQKLNARDFVL